MRHPIEVRLLSPRELADALGVSESSLKRWVDAGRIHAARTEGGHRKISLPEAVRFIRETNSPVARPDLLDMPEVALAHGKPVDRDALRDYLLDGDAVGARGWLLARYLDGQSIAELCDGPVREAMHRIGELWSHDRDGVFVEHRATDTCLQAIAHFRNMLAVAPDAPLALGATPATDPYLLPSMMAATVLAAAGMHAINLGPDTPVSALQRAFDRHHPLLVWVSASAPTAPTITRELAAWLDALPPSTIAVVGGQASAAIETRRPHVRRFDTMGQLAELATTVVQRASPASPR